MWKRNRQDRRQDDGGNTGGRRGKDNDISDKGRRRKSKQSPDVASNLMGNAAVKKHCLTAEKTGALNLSHAKLSEFPEQVEKLKGNLRLLDLSSNRFAKLPSTLTSFSQLKTLKLDHNLMTALPSDLGHLVKLETLSVNGNKLTSLPNLSSCTHLKSLSCEDNQLTEIPSFVFSLPHLDVLNMASNRITEIPDESRNLHVTELVLNRNQIRRVSSELAAAPRLKTLRLQENCLDLAGFPEALLTDSAVSTLTVEGNLFDMKQFGQLPGYDAYMERYTAAKKKIA